MVGCLIAGSRCTYKNGVNIPGTDLMRYNPFWQWIRPLPLSPEVTYGMQTGHQRKKNVHMPKWNRVQHCLPLDVSDLLSFCASLSLLSAQILQLPTTERAKINARPRILMHFEHYLLSLRKSFLHASMRFCAVEYWFVFCGFSQRDYYRPDQDEVLSTPIEIARKLPEDVLRLAGYCKTFLFNLYRMW